MCNVHIYQLSVCEEISALNLARKRSCNAVYLAAEPAKDTTIDHDLTIIVLRLNFSEKRVLPSLVLAGFTVYFATAAMFYFDF